ncbi:hypothetical protein L596_002174 [Steinernema carpocapsae]|uniref:G-protein coupled receptors family 1 profile domain-containing protein n=1 Tax=Steinernema carpocapsae TaxID=34508 RepID=A0A4U8UNF6_STECR|nr:hypothetical protein L596_002174 [Steinernema carpocapsae]
MVQLLFFLLAFHAFAQGGLETNDYFEAKQDEHFHEKDVPIVYSIPMKECYFGRSLLLILQASESIVFHFLRFDRIMALYQEEYLGDSIIAKWCLGATILSTLMMSIALLPNVWLMPDSLTSCDVLSEHRLEAYRIAVYLMSVDFMITCLSSSFFFFVFFRLKREYHGTSTMMPYHLRYKKGYLIRQTWLIPYIHIVHIFLTAFFYIDALGYPLIWLKAIFALRPLVIAFVGFCYMVFHKSWKKIWKAIIKNERKVSINAIGIIDVSICPNHVYWEDF